MLCCFRLFLPLLLASCATAGGEGQPDAYPGRNDGGLEIDADVGQPDAGPTACTTTLQSLAFDFEGGAEGFVHGDMPEVVGSGVDWTFDHWEVGSANTTCPSGQGCWGTNLDNNYIQCQRAYLVSPPIDLSDCGQSGTNVTLSFQHNYDFWTGPFGGSTWFDGGFIEITSDGTNWQPAGVLYPGMVLINPDQTSSFECIEKNNFYVHNKSGYVGASGGWVTEAVEIPAAMASVTFQIRFVYGAGVSSQTTSQNGSMAGTRPGWYIDDFQFH